VGFVGLLQVAFIVLKLCGVIDWSWWWVLAPTWIGAVLVILVVCAFLVAVLVGATRAHSKR
jgi:hypothetical protein